MDTQLRTAVAEERAEGLNYSDEEARADFFRKSVFFMLLFRCDVIVWEWFP